MKNILLISFFISSLGSLAIAQSSTSHLSVGVSAQAILTNTRVNEIKPGSGQALQAWFRYDLNPKSTIEFNAGFQSLGGFNQQSIAYTKNNYPTEYQLEVTNLQLTGINQWNAGASYIGTLTPTSSWSYSVGARLNYLGNVKGEQYESAYVVSSHYNNITETSLGGGSFFGAVESDQKPLSKDLFNPFGVGVNVRVFYEITPGLKATAGIEQNVVPLFKDASLTEDGNLFLTTISLGFSAQIW